jgi:hypothetical protein
MARHAHPERIYRAQRLGIRNRLAAVEMTEEAADRWCDAWEAESARQGLEPGEDYWTLAIGGSRRIGPLGRHPTA